MVHLFYTSRDVVGCVNMLTLAHGEKGVESATVPNVPYLIAFLVTLCIEILTCLFHKIYTELKWHLLGYIPEDRSQ